jgi:hypothetical protein
MTDFTIIIPHRGNPLGLWATIHSCESDLERTKFNYNYVIVTNGEELPEETRSTLLHLQKAGRLLKHEHSDAPLSPPEAREVGVRIADGKLLFFFDNHCLVSPRYFERAVLDFEKPEIDVLHSTTRFYTGDVTCYHYCLRLDYNFWAAAATMPLSWCKPYQIAAGGHGGFVVRQEAWQDLGGYGPASLLRGYGGEELIFDLKAGLLGKKVFLDPRLIHYHYTGNRGYTRHYTDEYYVNMLVSAHVIGGEKWMYRVLDSFINKGHLRIGAKQNMFDLVMAAYERSAEYAQHVAKSARCDLDELLKEYRRNQVAM